MEAVQELISTWQFYLVCHLFFITIFYQSYKAAVRTAQRDGAATILLQIVGSVSILLLAPFFAFEFPSGYKAWVLLLIASIFYALNDRANTTARKHLPVSTYSIISQMTTVFLMLIGFLVFKETPTVSKIVGGALIVLGNVLLAYKKGEIVINKFFGLAMFAAFIISIALSIDIGISSQFNLPIYIALTLFVPGGMIMAVEKIPYKEVKQEFDSNTRKYYLLTGIAWGLTIITLLKAYQLGEVTTVVPLSGTATLINVLVAYFIFHEKEDRIKKLIAAIIVVVGIAFTV